MENPLKKLITREPKAAPAMHSEAFSEYVGQSRRKVAKAIKESGRKAAGESEYNWLKNKKNWDTPEANQFKDGNWHFFFGAASGDSVPAAHWSETSGRFGFNDYWLGIGWDGGSRAVLRD